MHRHRETAASRSDPRCRRAAATEQASHGLAVQRRGHDDQFKMRGQGALRLKGERKAQIRIQAAFVKFVEEQDRDVFQRWVVLQQSGEQAFGNDFNACACGHLPVEAHAVAHGLAHGLAERGGHAHRHGARGEPPRFQHEDTAVTAPRGVEQRQRHHGTLAGAGRGLKHDGRIFRQCSQQCWQGLDNRQGGQ